MDQKFHSIKRLPPYVFAEANALKAEARGAGEAIADFGMGNPDQTPPHAIEMLSEGAQDPRVHCDSTSGGIPGLRKADAAYYARHFGEYGDHHVRFARVENEHRTRQAVRNIKGFFRSSEKILEEFEGRKRAS